jgi:four helix bundle protein
LGGTNNKARKLLSSLSRKSPPSSLDPTAARCFKQRKSQIPKRPCRKSQGSKSQAPNKAQAALTEDPNPNSQIPTMAEKPRDLEDRTFEFAQAVRGFVKQLPRTLANIEDVRQLVRASGSVAANWIEADEALSKKDFLMRAKICRKEAKESRLFLRLLDIGLTQRSIAVRDALITEARELTLIFSSIISKSG